MEHGVAQLAPALIAAWILVAVAFFALGILVYVAIRGRARGVDLERAVNDFRSLDVEAFRNLVDPAEEAFLRDNLSPRKFRAIKRQRMWAALIMPGKRGGPRRHLPRLAKPHNGAWTLRSRCPVFKLPRTLFGFDGKPSGLVSTCLPKSYCLACRADRSRLWRISTNGRRKLCSVWEDFHPECTEWCAPRALDAAAMLRASTVRGGLRWPAAGRVSP